MANNGHDGHCLQQLDEDVLSRANQSIRNHPQLIQCNFPLLESCRWQRTLFSPSGQFLAIIQSGDTCEEDDGTQYMDSSIILYSNYQSSTHSEKWSKIGERGPFLGLGWVNNPLLFHPSELGLVLVADEKTYFWGFPQSSHRTRDYRTDSIFREIHPMQLHNMTFTDSGKYLFGVCDEYDTVRITMPTGSGNSCSQPAMNGSSNEAHPDEANYELQLRVADKITSFTRAQGPLDISLSWEGDSVQSTTLRQHKDDSIVLSSLARDGREQDAILIRLPTSPSEMGVAPTLLDPLDDSPTISLAVNKAAQHKYDFRQHQAGVLPIIIERQKKTIDISVSKRYLRYSLDEGQPGLKRRRCNPEP